jgi:hypothetical protein
LKVEIKQIFLICQILEKKWDYGEIVHEQFIDSKKACDALRKEVLYNILIKLEVPIKVVMLIKMHNPIIKIIKMCLNETYDKIHIGKHFAD